MINTNSKLIGGGEEKEKDRRMSEEYKFDEKLYFWFNKNEKQSLL